MRKWDVFIIQHSHVDVGYTHRQEVIERCQRQFIRQALELADAPRQAMRSRQERFRFVCESFWAVELFWQSASPGERTAFLDAVRRGDIELTAFYLHMTELADEGTLQAALSRARDFCRQHGLELRSAMASDVNGLSWPVAQQLWDAGVRWLCTNINQHHGGYPLGGPLRPFWWETPRGQRLLVWNGLPYHRANLLGLIPGWQGSENAGIPGLVMDAPGGYVHVQDISRAEKQLTALLEGLEAQGYPFPVLPLMGSALYTDNSPASDAYCQLIADWNAVHGDTITLHSATLEDFFGAFEKYAGDLPVCRGDWNDWWSDGVASTPAETALFRNAQRTRNLVMRLDPGHSVITAERLRAIDHQLTLYAEHTWGHSHAAQTDLIVSQTFARKGKYAIEADELACRALDDVLAARGEGDFRAGQELAFKVINPSDEAVRAAAYLPLYAWEEPAARAGVTVADAAGNTFPHQLVSALRCTEVCTILDMAPGEERVLKLIPGGNSLPAEPAPEGCFRNAYYELRWNAEQGVHAFIDLTTGESLLDGSAGLGAPVYQIFPGGDRWAAGGYNFQPRTVQACSIHHGTLEHIRVTEHGPVRTRLEASYAVAGTLSYAVEYTLFPDLPQLLLTVKTLKQHEPDPEGLYAAFPFRPGGTWYLDKAGCFLRPGVDQIPGTCTDYYCVGDGVVCAGQRSALALTTLDAPLMHFGGLNLWHYSTDRIPSGPVYAWLTNNKWDTNFRRLTGGAYSFRYVLEAGAHLLPEESAFRRCRENAMELLTIRL
ncbi:MAG: hypothetical protein IJE07_11245 [Clostridia bacterium]|nr:hypothetical protein [Clostridia bacterium]